MSHPSEKHPGRIKIWQSAIAGAMRRIASIVLGIVASPYTTLALLVLSLALALLVGLQPLGKMEPQGVSYTQRIPARGQTLPPFLVDGGGDLALPARALLTTLIALCALRATHALIDQWQLPVPPRHLTHAETFTLQGDAKGLRKRASRALSATGHRFTATASGEGTRRGTARTQGPDRWFVGALYIGLCLLFLAPLLHWRWGWRSQPLPLSLGDTRSMERVNTDITLDQIAFTPRADGRPRIFEARILAAHGKQEDYLTVGLDRGARQRGIGFYYLGYGPAVRVRAQDDRGTPLDIQQMPGDAPPQPVWRVRFPQEQQERLLSIAEADLILTLVNYRAIPGRETDGRTLQIQAVKRSTGRIVAESMLTESGTVPIQDTVLDVRFEYYAILQTAYEPELVAAILGGILTLLGLCGTLVRDPHRMWVIMKEGDDRCHYRLTVLRRHAKASWFLSTKEKLQEGEGDGDGDD